jgi:NAD(P)-dependent dehydrogenase (short-subunit alcohol dehydrogenase family)
MSAPLTRIDAQMQPADDALANKVVLVTGATGTLGRLAALACARAGATVVLHGKRSHLLDHVYDEVEAAGGRAPANVVLDLAHANDAEFKGLAETIHATFRRLDGIVHAANHCKQLMPMTLQTASMWDAYWQVNVRAPLQITRACWPMLKRANGARVVFTSESHAAHPQAYWGAYASSKAALEHAVATWRDECAIDDPTLCLYVPGPIASNSRGVTHPGELATEVRDPSTIAKDFVLLLAGDRRLFPLNDHEPSALRFAPPPA